MRQIILDTETTGRDVNQGHRIIELGCIELINRRLTGKHFHSYLNANRASEAGALAIHGLTEEFLNDKPSFSEIASPFLEFIKGAQLIIHNAVFDISFLNHELSLLKEKLDSIEHYSSVFDTLSLARQLHPGQRNSLDALCKRYNIDNTQRNLHGALLDAQLLAQVYLAMTGGQNILFENASNAYIPSPNSLNTNSSLIPLLIRHANEEELSEHLQRLKDIKKKSGVNLWNKNKDV